MNHPKLHPAGSTTDSFESNLLQIEHTNKLLANIENKLNNFFHKNTSNPLPSSFPLQEQDVNSQASSEKQPSILSREDFIPKIGNTLLSPIQNSHNRESIQNFISGDGEFNLRNSNNYIKIFDSSKPYESNTSEIYQSTSNIKGYHPTSESHLEITNENQDFSITEHSENRFSLTKDPYNRRRIERIKSSQHELMNERERNLKYWSKDENGKGTDDIDKKYYEKKVQILEERLENSESEVRHLLNVKDNLNNDLIRLKAQLSEAHNRYIEDLSRSLKVQEERLRKEFEQNLKYREEYKLEEIKYI